MQFCFQKLYKINFLFFKIREFSIYIVINEMNDLNVKFIKIIYVSFLFFFVF